MTEAAVDGTFLNTHRYYLQIDAGSLTGPRVECCYDPDDTSRPCYPLNERLEPEANYGAFCMEQQAAVAGYQRMVGHLTIEIQCTRLAPDAFDPVLRINPHEARAVPPPRCPHRSPGTNWQCELDKGHEEYGEPKCTTSFALIDDVGEATDETDSYEWIHNPRLDSVAIRDMHFVPGDSRLAVDIPGDGP